jgi:GMP synthase-like glutamine amidotransferase
MASCALILQNAAGEGPGILRDILLRKGWVIRLVRLHRDEKIPSDWKNHGLLMSMGGPMNVYEEDRFPFLAQETSVIREALAAGMPTLGFCLGAQLMAKAAGAKVRRGGRREIGWHRVSLTAHGTEDPLLKSFPLEFTVFQWHGDTFDLPNGGVRLVSSEHYPNQAMRLGSLSYGFQFHVEVTGEMISRWLDSYRDEVQEMGDPGLAKRVRRKATTHLAKLHDLGEAFFNRYLNRLIKG